MPVIESMRTAQKNVFRRHGISNDDQLRRLIPRKYKDYRVPALLGKTYIPENGLDLAVPGTIESVQEREKNGRTYVTLKAKDREGTPFSCVFIHDFNHLFSILQRPGTEVLFMGKFNYGYFGYSVFEPKCSVYFDYYLKLLPVYTKMGGVSEKSMKKYLEEALGEKETDTIPGPLRENFPEENAALSMVHHPAAPEDYLAGKTRLILDDMVYLKSALFENSAMIPSNIRFTKRENTDRILSGLPYELTGDQKHAIEAFCDAAESGRKTEALVQGDVGCGKTIIAFACMMRASENGYQSVLMAPTQILASQHYEALCGLTGKDKVACFIGNTPKADRERYRKGIADGSIPFVVGTSAILFADMKFKGLGLAIVDEEHRFGVKQREGIMGGPVHTMVMSATPIPRSLARAIYGESMLVLPIREKPAGRKDVKTYLDSGDKIKPFLKKALDAGYQAYVVCPLKTENEDEDSDLVSAEETYEEYTREFAKYGYKAGLVTGATKNTEKDRIIEDFRTGRIHILIATTVIEVGVNVPNANAIVIRNAERFGLATLHQLRGRVGRGTKQAYCILETKDYKNQRLGIMCRTSDGFAIAEEDLRERESGQLLGTAQSGRNRIIDEIIANPALSEIADSIVKKMSHDERMAHICKFEKIYPQAET